MCACSCSCSSISCVVLIELLSDFRLVYYGLRRTMFVSYSSLSASSCLTAYVMDSNSCSFRRWLSRQARCCAHLSYSSVHLSSINLPICIISSCSPACCSSLVHFCSASCSLRSRSSMFCCFNVASSCSVSNSSSSSPIFVYNSAIFILSLPTSAAICASLAASLLLSYAIISYFCRSSSFTDYFMSC